MRGTDTPMASLCTATIFCGNYDLIQLHRQIIHQKDGISIRTWLKSSPKPSLKIGSANKAGCFGIEASSLLAYLRLFFRNTFFFKIESYVFDLRLRETLRTFRSFRQHSEDTLLWRITQSDNRKKEIKISEWAECVEIWWGFMIFFQTDAENFSSLSWKTKKFYSWKNI